MTTQLTLPDLISVEEFFRQPEKGGAQISPDGTRISYLAPREDLKNRLNIWVQDLDSDEPARCVTADVARSVFHFAWTDDPRWLLYLQDTGGDENWHVFRVDLDDPDADAVDLTPFPGAMAVFELLPDKPGRALVQCNKRDHQQMDVYELDIGSGELEILVRNPGDVRSWLTSRRGDLFGTRLTNDGDLEILQWERESEPRLIATYDGADYTLGFYPLTVTPDGSGIWMGSNEGTDHTRLVRLDVADGRQYAVDKHPTMDIDVRSQVWPGFPEPLITSRRTGELLAVRYLGERQEIHALDPQFAEVLANLQKLSDGDIGLISSDLDGRRWVVGFNHDRDPGATYLYDHATGESRLLYRPYPHLKPEQLAPMQAVTIPSRDGLDLPAYLTLPVGSEGQGPVPLVLLVHGGPWTRDAWMYAPGVQLLANRGYAVLQVNFRGSAGYGKAFVKAAIGEFAGKMHDDLIDGVEWAIAQGYADRDRVAIFGGSYGGYATLVGVTFTPDVFAAAIDYVGISSLANFMRTLPEIARPNLANNWHLFVGNPDVPEELEDMLARSPITKVDRITTPLLVIQGANDVRVVQAESDNLVEALRARGVDVEYMVKEDEGHGFVNPENTIDMFHAVDRFLAEHLGGRTG